MRHVLALILALAWIPVQAATPCPDPGLSLPPLPALAAARASGAVTIVALGSSSTEGAGASGPEATYPARLRAALASLWPGVAVRVVNAGRGGETAEETAARIAADVLPHRPDLVLWQAGGNEALKNRDPAGFRAALAEGLRALGGVPVVLVDNQAAPRLAARGGLFDAALGEAGPPVWRRSRAMAEWARRGEGALIGPDGLHHDDRGYQCVGEALAQALAAAAGTPWQGRAFAAQQRP